MAYDDLVAAGSMKEAKNGGTVRAEGKEYEVQDSDVLLFLFNRAEKHAGMCTEAPLPTHDGPVSSWLCPA